MHMIRQTLLSIVKKIVRREILLDTYQTYTNGFKEDKVDIKDSEQSGKDLLRIKINSIHFCSMENKSSNLIKYIREF
jgi:hypothetical protein